MNRQEYNKIYREKNKKVLRAYDKAYYEKHKNLKQKQKLALYYKMKDTPEYKAKRKKYYEENKETIYKANRQYKKEHRARYTELSKLSREKKLELLAGRPRPDICEVCGANEKIVYDHDHATGKFRGWICFSCNTSLGHARDNVEVLYKLIDYLNQSRGLVVINQSELSSNSKII